MDFQRKAIRVEEESHFLPSISVRPNGLARDAPLSKLFYLGLDVFHMESQVAQAAGFRAADSLRRVFLRENLQFRIGIYAQIQLPIPPFRPIFFPYHLETQPVNIKLLRRLIIGYDDSNMMNGGKFISEPPLSKKDTINWIKQ